MNFLESTTSEKTSTTEIPSTVEIRTTEPPTMLTDDSTISEGTTDFRKTSVFSLTFNTTIDNFSLCRMKLSFTLVLYFWGRNSLGSISLKKLK